MLHQGFLSVSSAFNPNLHEQDRHVSRIAHKGRLTSSFTQRCANRAEPSYVLCLGGDR